MKPTNSSRENSLDPRVQRLPALAPTGTQQIDSTDQLTSFEVFVQPRKEKPFQHEGSVRASDKEMAFVLAKETFTRRFLCVALWVVETRYISVSDLKEGEANIYDVFEPVAENPGGEWFEVFEMHRRGKQPTHTGKVRAGDALAAFSQAKRIAKPGANACNLWVVPAAQIRYTSDQERILWDTLPDKKFRDASEYKGGDKLKTFLENKTDNAST